MYLDAVLAFVVAMAVAAALTPVAARFARRVGAIAMPSERGLATRQHAAAGRSGDPGRRAGRGGDLDARDDQAAANAWGREASGGTVDTWGLMAGAVLIAVVGAIDDARDLPPLGKLIGQIAAAVIAVEAGARVTDVTLPFVGALQFPHDGGALTVLWLVALMNVVNFSDGVDGLAAGTVHDRRGGVRDHRVRSQRRRGRRSSRR